MIAQKLAQSIEYWGLQHPENSADITRVCSFKYKKRWFGSKVNGEACCIMNICKGGLFQSYHRLPKSHKGIFSTHPVPGLAKENLKGKELLILVDEVAKEVFVNSRDFVSVLENNREYFNLSDMHIEYHKNLLNTPAMQACLR